MILLHIPYQTLLKVATSKVKVRTCIYLQGIHHSQNCWLFLAYARFLQMYGSSDLSVANNSTLQGQSEKMAFYFDEYYAHIFHVTSQAQFMLT